jgi:hypothetical protein
MFWMDKSKVQTGAIPAPERLPPDIVISPDLRRASRSHVRDGVRIRPRLDDQSATRRAGYHPVFMALRATKCDENPWRAVFDGAPRVANRPLQEGRVQSVCSQSSGRGWRDERLALQELE